MSVFHTILFTFIYPLNSLFHSISSIARFCCSLYDLLFFLFIIHFLHYLRNVRQIFLILFIHTRFTNWFCVFYECCLCVQRSIFAYFIFYWTIHSIAALMMLCIVCLCVCVITKYYKRNCNYN